MPDAAADANTAAAVQRAEAGGATYCSENLAEGFFSGFGENPRTVHAAKVTSEAMMKLSQSLDSEVEEGSINCTIAAGSTLKYSAATKMGGGVIWLSLTEFSPDWGCPRAFSSTNIFMDEDKLILNADRKL